MSDRAHARIIRTVQQMPYVLAPGSDILVHELAQALLFGQLPPGAVVEMYEQQWTVRRFTESDELCLESEEDGTVLYVNGDGFGFTDKPHQDRPTAHVLSTSPQLATYMSEIMDENARGALLVARRMAHAALCLARAMKRIEIRHEDYNDAVAELEACALELEGITSAIGIDDVAMAERMGNIVRRDMADVQIALFVAAEELNGMSSALPFNIAVSAARKAELDAARRR